LKFLKLFVVVDMDGSFPMSHATFGLTVHELECFLDFSLASGMLSATAHAANSAQNCQNLPKFAPKAKL
jgi:hypothetical protein